MDKGIIMTEAGNVKAMDIIMYQGQWRQVLSVYRWNNLGYNYQVRFDLDDGRCTCDFNEREMIRIC